jgi:ribosome-binding factor A
MGRASDRRVEQVKSLLQRTLDEVIREEIKDPRVGIFSITQIHLSKDLSFADVFVAVIGGREATDESVKVLNRASPLIWNRVREATDLRSVPRLRFSADHSGEYTEQIYSLLETLRPQQEEADSNTGDEADSPPAQEPESADVLDHDPLKAGAKEVQP